MRGHLAGLLVFALVASVTAATPAADATRAIMDPDPVALPENTWVKIKSDRDPVGRSYSGLCCGGGWLFYFGGGHGSHAANDVELYEIASNRWIQATDPEDWRQADRWSHLTPEDAKRVKDTIGGGSTTTSLSPKGRPLVHHTYQMHAWFPEEKAFYNLVRACLWAFDPVRREWKLISDKCPQGRDVHTWGLRYAPERQSMIAIIAAGPERGVYLYDRLKSGWNRKCDTPAADWSEVHAAYDPAHKRHVVRSNRRWWTVDTATWQVRAIADLNEARRAAGLKGGALESLSMDYDPATRATLVILKGADGAMELWAHDGDKDKWAPVAMKGNPPKGIANWGLLDYDPVHQCHWFLNLLSVGGGFEGGRTDGLFAFRLAPTQE
jgi:hypothetical protein